MNFKKFATSIMSFVLFLGLAVNASAQNVVKGKVVDQNGQPVIGAAVLVLEDATKGAITDENGDWSLDVKAGQTLQFSSIGFVTSTSKVGSAGVINITLNEDVNLLDDVVVIGYGTARKADLTGATSSMNGSRLKSTTSPLLANQLQGQMAGVQVTRSSGNPASGATIRVRGVTTISNNDPLVIIDGVPGNLNDVASEDVKDIQVLKDAASAAIYGSRAAAGVILVTTKRAKSKEFNMSYNFETGIDKPTAVPQFANAVEWMKGCNEMRYNDGGKTLNEAYSDELINSYNAKHLADPDSYPDVDWMSYLKKTASHQRHSFTVSGGTDKIKTNFSMNYYNSDRILEVGDYSRLNLRSSNDLQINDWIHATADFNVIYSNQVNPHNNVGSYMYENSLMPAEWTNGQLAEGKDGDNPYAVTILSGQSTGKGYRLSGKMQIDLTPVKGLTLSAAAAPSYYFYKGKDHVTKYNVYKINGDAMNGQNYPATNLSESRNDSHNLTMQFYANYKLDVNKHSFSAMAGYEDYQNEWENTGASRSNYSLDNYPYLNIGPADYQYNSGSAGHNAYRSVFGRVMYSYANKYLLQANVRADGSSRFSKSCRWGVFPSVSAGWVISEEPWFKNGVVSYMKLRASYGQLGNERISDSEHPNQAILNFGTGYIPNTATGTTDIVQTAYQSDYAFDTITWETTTTYGLGLDANFFDGRLRFSGDVYHKETSDMLVQIGFPLYFGMNPPKNNAALMYTNGWDLELGWNDHVGDFNYGVNFNISDYRSKMGYMADRQEISGNKITEEGSYYQEWYMYKSDGIILNEAGMYDANGDKIAVISSNDKPGCIKYVDLGGGADGEPDGKITASGDRTRLGNSLPEYLYGGSLFAEWKGIDFNVSFQGVGHQLKYWSWAATPYNYQTYSCPKNLIDSHWSPAATDEQNAKAKYPMITTGNTNNVYAASDFYLFNGAYCRVKNITLGYTLPKSFTQKLSINKLRLYTAINDLPAFSKYPKGYDPEWDKSSDFIMTSFIFGVNLTF
ncbi:MAG: TonB-dependent receptor [Bacteroidales bacterium]|nr:TonB-dependent receptor [Bacteroidales bacterium]